jgi:uncharacterized protein (TIGR03067 family)
MTDLDRLQGAWNITSLEMDGRQMPAPTGACIVIEGARFQSLGMGAVYEGKVEVDGTKKPKTFDLLFTAGPEKGNRSLGIYQLKGDDWKICLTVTGKKRPTKFATTPGSGCALETLTRGMCEVMDGAAEESSESSDAAAVSSGAGDPAPEIEGEWQMVACNADGYPVPESMVKTGKRVARGGVTESYFGAQRIMKARYTVDRGAEPYGIDYALKDGGSQYGIWKFEGDILHICFAPAGQSRPADFTARKGQGHTFTSWRRVTEK